MNCQGKLAVEARRAALEAVMLSQFHRSNRMPTSELGITIWPSVGAVPSSDGHRFGETGFVSNLFGATLAWRACSN